MPTGTIAVLPVIQHVPSPIPTASNDLLLLPGDIAIRRVCLLVTERLYVDRPTPLTDSIQRVTDVQMDRITSVVYRDKCVLARIRDTVASLISHNHVTGVQIQIR